MPPARSAMLSRAAMLCEESAPNFEQIFTSHHRTVYAAAYGVLRDGGLAEDVTQEVFLKLHQHLDRLQGESRATGEPLRAWLIRVTVNEARNTLRGRTRSAVRDESFGSVAPTHAPAPDIDYEKRQQISAANQALASIGEPMRSCLLLKQYGLSYREIATTVGINENSVGSLVARARKEFAKKFGRLGGDTAI